MATNPADWWSITVTDTEALGLNHQLQDAWVSRALAQTGATARMPEESAVFTSRDAWESVDFYFTPAAAVLLADFLERHGGVACGPPRSDEVALLVGNDSAWDLLEGGRPR